jgi:DNA-binding response OmpR family regulator
MSTSYPPGAPADGPFTTPGAEPSVGTGPSVMVIDDSPAVRTIIAVSFARMGTPVSSFGDGISAFRALARHEVVVPSVLLLDLGLPRMNGYEVAALLRNHDAFANTVVLMLTARDGMIDRLRAKMLGARGYITKPFRVQEVVNTVCAHLNLPALGGSPVHPYGGSGGIL